MVGKKSKEEKK